LKEKAPEGSVVLSFDEKGRTPVKHYGGARWGRDKQYRIPYNQKVKGLFDILAVKNVHTGERHYQYYDWKNSFIVIDFIEWLSTAIYPENELYFILDNWSAHRSNAFGAYIDLHPRVHPVYLPTTASWMNDVERDFSRIQKEVLNNSDFNSPREVMNMVSSFFEDVLNSC
jgi:transposase